MSTVLVGPERSMWPPADRMAAILLLERRLQSDEFPEAARLNDPVVVQTQQFNCGTTAGGEAVNNDAVTAPDKMLTPELLSRTEQGDSLTIYGICRRLSRPFELITTVAGQAEVPWR